MFLHLCFIWKSNTNNLSSLRVDNWFTPIKYKNSLFGLLRDANPLFLFWHWKDSFCNLNSQICLVVYSEILKISATSEIDKWQGIMAKSSMISPLSSVITSFSLNSSTNQQQSKQSVLFKCRFIKCYYNFFAKGICQLAYLPFPCLKGPVWFDIF